MNLLEMRLKFRELSGRYDLVDSLGADVGVGATFFLNEGRKFLDKLDETKQSLGTCFRILEAGQFSTYIPQCRAIRKVYCATSEGRYEVYKRTYDELISNYISQIPADRGQGYPTTYAPCILRNIPDNATIASMEALIGFIDIPTSNDFDSNSIILSCPVDQQVVLSITGLFYSAELVNDTDTNYWSVAHPMTLYAAAMRFVEVANRNTQGVKDWESAIATEMKMVGMDYVEEEIATIDQMKG